MCTNAVDFLHRCSPTYSKWDRCCADNSVSSFHSTVSGFLHPLLCSTHSPFCLWQQKFWGSYLFLLPLDRTEITNLGTAERSGFCHDSSDLESCMVLSDIWVNSLPQFLLEFVYLIQSSLFVIIPKFWFQKGYIEW